MAKATPIPVQRPGVLLELDADEAEELMTYIDGIRSDTPEREQRRSQIYSALHMAEVRPVSGIELRLSEDRVRAAARKETEE